MHCDKKADSEELQRVCRACAERVGVPRAEGQSCTWLCCDPQGAAPHGEPRADAAGPGGQAAASPLHRRRPVAAGGGHERPPLHHCELTHPPPPPPPPHMSVRFQSSRMLCCAKCNVTAHGKCMQAAASSLHWHRPIAAGSSHARCPSLPL